MRKSKKIKSLMVVAVLVLSIVSVSNVNTKAASNPYRGGYANCTWTAWQLCYNTTGRALPAWGNAGNWLNNAKRAGWSTGSTPRVNSVAVWYGGGYGHVGWVTGVSGNRIYVKEGNYNGKYHEGWLPASGYRNGYQYMAGYIYVGYNPQGYIDSCSGGNGFINVKGWAFDKDNKSQSIQVHVYIGGYAGNRNAEGHALTANVTRNDVNRVYGLSGRHGYSNIITTNKRGRQLVTFYAINIGTGSNVYLGSRTVNISNTRYLKRSCSSITVSRGRTGSFRVYYYGGNTTLYSSIGNSSVASKSWGKWDKKTKSIPIYVKGLRKGSTTIYLSNSKNSDRLKVNVYVK